MTARVKDVMTRNVVAVHEQAGYKDIVAVMCRHAIWDVAGVVDIRDRLTYPGQ